MENLQELLNQYLLLQLQYVKFEKYMKNELENLLIEEGIKYQQLTGRIKTIDSIEKKIKKHPYLIEELNNDIRNMNDLCGIRIVLYDNNNLNNIFQVIKSKYDIVEIKSKGFNYNANNIIIRIKTGVFSEYLCEIQLVTIMSHNLIEIGHDIIYKNDELFKIDKQEMELISQEYEECLENVYKLETRIDIIKKRAENLKNNLSLYNYVISNENIELLYNNKSISFFYQKCNELQSIAGYLSRNGVQAKSIRDNKVIVILTSNLGKLENDGIYTKEFVFDSYMSVMEIYSNVWIEDIKEVFKEILCYLEKESNERMNKRFFSMIKNIVQYGIKNNNWFIFDKIKEYINNEKEHPIIVAKIINSIIDNNITYTESKDHNTVQLIRKGLSYTKKGKEMVKTLFKRCCKLFVINQDNEIYKVLIDLTYKLDFLVEEILIFFDSNINAISDYYKYDVIKKLYYSYCEMIKSSDYYKKIYEDNFYKIWKYLYYDHFDEECAKKEWKKGEKKKQQALSEYIDNINNKDNTEIERILDCYNFLLDHNLRIPFNLQKYIYLIGKNYKLATNLYRKNNNPYLYLGLKENNRRIAKRDDLEILRALRNVYVENIFNSFISEKRNFEKDQLICDIILSWNLFTKSDKMKTIIKILSYYNNMKKIVRIDFLSEDFLKCLTPDECNIILKNFRYVIEEGQDFMGIDFMELFFVFPENTRKFIKQLAMDNIKLDSRIELYITSAKNYQKERINNVMLILELLKEKESFQIWRYVSQLVERRDKYIVNDLLEIIADDSSEQMIKAMIKLIFELEIEIKETWKILKEILLKTTDAEITNDIESLLTKIDSANSFYEAYKIRKNEINKIKKSEKDKRIRKILNNSAIHCSKMMDFEKLQEVKRNVEKSFSISKIF